MRDPIEEPAKAESSEQTADQTRHQTVAFRSRVAAPKDGRRPRALGLECVKLLIEAIERGLALVFTTIVWARVVRLGHRG